MKEKMKEKINKIEKMKEKISNFLNKKEIEKTVKKEKYYMFEKVFSSKICFILSFIPSLIIPSSSLVLLGCLSMGILSVYFLIFQKKTFSFSGWMNFVYFLQIKT